EPADVRRSQCLSLQGRSVLRGRLRSEREAAGGTHPDRRLTPARSFLSLPDNGVVCGMADFIFTGFRSILGAMMTSRPFAPVRERLKVVVLRPTRQRLALARLLFEVGDRHVTAEQLHGEAQAAKIRLSLATVYTTLHQFTAHGLLREVVVEPG